MEFLKKYFYGQLTPQEETRVQDWLAEHFDEPQVQEMLETLMSEMEAEDREMSSAAFDEVSAKLGLDRKNRRRNRAKTAGLLALKAAACLLLIVTGAAAYGLLVPEKQTEWAELKVPYGQTESLELSDGTQIRLNSGSRITYPSSFRGKERRIFVDGEIYAEVARDSRHPFHITSGNVEVKVLGTKFNFKSFDDSENVELLLFEGAVQVDVATATRTRQVVLHPGEMLQYDRESGKINLDDFNPGIYKDFYDDGAIHFFNLPMKDIASDLERLFGTRIVILDESLADCRFFAWFTNDETLEQILYSLNADGRMEISRDDGVIYIDRK